MAAIPLSDFARAAWSIIFFYVALASAPWLTVKAADCPTTNGAKEHKAGSYHFRYESRAENGSENDKFVFVRCVENKKDTSLYIDWKKIKLSGYVDKGDVSKTEVEFSPRQKLEESSELWYGARPERLNVNLVRHKEEQSLLPRLLGFGLVHAQPSVRYLKELPLIKDIDSKWPQKEAIGTLRSYTVISVPVTAEDVKQDKTVVSQRLMRISIAVVSRVVRTKDGYRYEVVFTHQYAPNQNQQGAPFHRIRSTSNVFNTALKNAGLTGALQNLTSFASMPQKLPSVDDKNPPRARLERLDVTDPRGVVLATVPVAVWEPAQAR